MTKPAARLALSAVVAIVLASGCGGTLFDKATNQFTVVSVEEESHAFDPVSNAWSSRTAMPFASPAQSGTVGPSGRVYVLAGGTNLALRFDRNAPPPAPPGLGAWELLPFLPEPRVDATAVAAGNQIVLASGIGAGGAIPFVEVLDDTATTPTWARIATPFRRSEAVVVGTADKLYVLGGRDEAGTAQSEVWELTPVTTTGTWTLRGNLSTVRQLAGGFTLANKVHVVSGHAGDGVPLGSEDVFDLATAQVVTPNSIPTARLAPQAVVVGDRALVYDSRLVATVALGRLDSFREVEGWTARASHPNPMFLPSAASSGSRLIVAGGADGRESTNQTHAYDASSNTWVQVGNILGKRHAGLLVEVGPNTFYTGGYEAERERKELDAWDFLGF